MIRQKLNHTRAHTHGINQFAVYKVSSNTSFGTNKQTQDKKTLNMMQVQTVIAIYRICRLPITISMQQCVTLPMKLVHPNIYSI